MQPKQAVFFFCIFCYYLCKIFLVQTLPPLFYSHDPDNNINIIAIILLTYFACATVMQSQGQVV